VTGFAALAFGLVTQPRQAAFSYLTAWAFGFTLAFGALAFAITGYLTHAKWVLAVRRITEAVTLTIPLFALLFVPLALEAPTLYVWAASASTWPPALAAAIATKVAYLNLPFWYARAAGFFAVWSAVVWLLRRWSVQADAHASPELTGNRRALSGALAPALALTLTFASFDWLMSLDPTWVSNAYGFYVFAAAFLGGTSLITLLAVRARAAGTLPREVGANHFHALGNVLLATTLFWAYIAFVQLMMIWMADLPVEVTWYVVRSHGSWAVVCWVLGIGHFALPFFALLLRGLKRNPRTLTALALWQLALHFVDIYWLVMPALHPEGVRVSWLDVAALAAVLGTAGAFALWRFAAVPPLPVSDPDLAQGLRLEMP
jgi:hypothetical protein